MTRLLAFALACAAVAFAAGLDDVRAEQNLEKRSKLAIDYADSAIDSARKLYAAGDYKAALDSLAEVREAVDLSHDSLEDTGKNARKHSKPFKKAELGIRELLRRLKGLELDFGVDDREAVIAVERHLQKLHDDLIAEIMSKRK